ncbi:MAG: protein kinase [Cognatishimia sp.]|uniref:serine/threonine protein kinase n=1 Tax=Cognatishimia sp. TaxID=2211648 RepID=UPI003B8E6BBC
MTKPIVLPEHAEFNRPKRFRCEKVLSPGACGETVLLQDEEMDLKVVAKKYKPVIEKASDPVFFNELFERFKTEAKILFQLNHPYIVRVFNFYDYSEKDTAYILMEYVDGYDINEYLKEHPEHAELLFERVIDAFVHLEAESILHRDIRPANVLVTIGAIPKIIDFGFGKHTSQKGFDDSKSISLNWWCETPPEFERGVYDHQTEVYFIGKLFEFALKGVKQSSFGYTKLLKSMCERSRSKRAKSFRALDDTLSKSKLAELNFSVDEIEIYREFANTLSTYFASIERDAEFNRDSEQLIAFLDSTYRKSMLEEYYSDPGKVASAFVHGAYQYWKNKNIYVEETKKFIDLLKQSTLEKRKIILDNLYGRLEAIDKYSISSTDLDDEIPF